MNRYQVKVYKKLNDKLVESWRALWQESKYANFFNSYEFHLVCRKTFKNEEHEIFCLEKNGKVIAILPLIKKKVFGIPCYVNPGGRFIEKSPFLFRYFDKKESSLLVNRVLATGNLHLSELPSEVAKDLKSIYQKSLVSIISVNPYIDLRQDNYTHMGKKNLNKLKNRIHKNKKKIKHLHKSMDLKSTLKTVFDLEEKSRKGKNGKQIFDNEVSRKFYMNLICNSKNVVFDLLTYEGRPFVSAIGVVSNGRYHAYHTCYLREYKYFIPGKMLTHFMLKKIKTEGVNTFDFGRGFSDFKIDYTKDYSIQYNLYLSSNNFINIWWKVINYIRRVKIILFKPKFSKDHQYLFKTT